MTPWPRVSVLPAPIRCNTLPDAAAGGGIGEVVGAVVGCISTDSDRTLEVLHQPLGRGPRLEIAGVGDALPAVIAERNGKAWAVSSGKAAECGDAWVLLRAEALR